MIQALKRQEQREALSRAVFYYHEEEGHDERYFAVTVNTSKCGACIFTDRPIEEGEVILVESGLWTSVRSAKIVWTNRLGDSLIEAGLSLC